MISLYTHTWQWKHILILKMIQSGAHLSDLVKTAGSLFILFNLSFISQPLGSLSPFHFNAPLVFVLFGPECVLLSLSRHMFVLITAVPSSTSSEGLTCLKTRCHKTLCMRTKHNQSFVVWPKLLPELTGNGLIAWGNKGTKWTGWNQRSKY